MSTEPTSSPTPNTWLLPALFAALLLSGVGAVYYAFYQQASLNQRLMAQTTALAGRTQQLETALRIAKAQAVDASAIAALSGELRNAQAENEALEKRLVTLEQTVTAKPPTIEIGAAPAGATETLQRFVKLQKAISEGHPYTTELSSVAALPQLTPLLPKLQEHATDGIASEATLRDQLAATLDQHPAPSAVVEDKKLDGFNNRLKGLLHISRIADTGPDPYATLRTQSGNGATIDVLIASIKSLPEESAAPFTSWRAQAEARQSTIAALSAVQSALMAP